jgi:hypothetical protein
MTALFDVSLLKDGWTPLHLASYNDRVDFVALLIEHGANPDVVDFVVCPITPSSFQTVLSQEQGCHMCVLIIQRTGTKGTEGFGEVCGCESFISRYERLSVRLRWCCFSGDALTIIPNEYRFSSSSSSSLLL